MGVADERDRRRVVLDSGGLSALCSNSLSARTRVRWLHPWRGTLQIPTVILAESTTGDPARDAALNNLLRVLERVPYSFVPCDEITARRAGRLRHAARSDDGIDAIVAAVAVGDGSAAILLTSDPQDMRRLLAKHPQVGIVRV